MGTITAEPAIAASERTARLAELVSLLSDCPLRTAARLVASSPASDPLLLLAQSLCAALPAPVARQQAPITDGAASATVLPFPRPEIIDCRSA